MQTRRFVNLLCAEVERGSLSATEIKSVELFGETEHLQGPYSLMLPNGGKTGGRALGVLLAITPGFGCWRTHMLFWGSRMLAWTPIWVRCSSP